MHSIDVLAMSNPMLGGLAVRALATGYVAARGEPMPLAYVFIAVPLLYAANSQGDVFNASNRTTGFLNWVSRHQEILPDFPRRARALSPFTRKWIYFGVQHRLLLLEDAALTPCSDGLQKEPRWPSKEFRGALLSHADRLGFWLGGNVSQGTVFAALGVRP